MTPEDEAKLRSLKVLRTPAELASIRLMKVAYEQSDDLLCQMAHLLNIGRIRWDEPDRIVDILEAVGQRHKNMVESMTHVYARIINPPVMVLPACPREHVPRRPLKRWWRFWRCA